MMDTYEKCKLESFLYLFVQAVRTAGLDHFVNHIHKYIILKGKIEKLKKKAKIKKKLTLVMEAPFKIHRKIHLFCPVVCSLYVYFDFKTGVTFCQLVRYLFLLYL